MLAACAVETGNRPDLEVSAGVEEVGEVMVAHADAFFDEVCLVAAELTLKPVLCGLCPGVHSLHPGPVNGTCVSSPYACTMA